jgi:hypothetical protein
MKIQIHHSLKTAAFAALALVAVNATAATNAWISPVSGKWETSTNWSLGSPSSTDSGFVTNAGTKTVTIDATTATFTSTMTVANLTFGSPTNSSTNTLFLNNIGTGTPLHVVSNLTLLPGGTITITNSALTVDNGNTPLTIPNGSYVQLGGVVTVNNSILNTSNALETIVGILNGGAGPGTINMTNSVFTPHQLTVGTFSDGTANFVNCTSVLGTAFVLGQVNGYSGNANIIGGQFLATNTHSGFFANLVEIGDRGPGNLTVSNADVQFGGTTLGDIRGSAGTITLQSGTMTLGKTSLGNDAEPGPPGPTASGSILVSGGQMTVTELHIGVAATGTVSVVNGTLSAPIVTIGETNTATGTLNISGGSTYISSYLSVGSNNPNASVSVTAGALYVTNASHTATTILNGGTLFQGAGVFKTDNLIITNGGGVITISNIVLGANAGTTNTLAVSGTLTLTNATLGIGNDGTTNAGAGTGIATITNGTLNATTVNLGSTAGGVGSLTVQSNAAVNISSNLTLVSSSLTTTSTITMSGGSLNVTNGIVRVGAAGAASVAQNAGTVTVRQLQLGNLGSAGNYILSGGTLRAIAAVNSGDRISLNFILVNGGDLDGSGTTVIVGEGHNATMQVDSGSSRAGFMYCGYSPGFTGTYLQNGGVSIVYTNLIVGDCVSGAIGVPTLNGGSLSVTNPAHTAVLDIRNGTFTLNPGATLVVDHLVMTNACGHFVNLGGTLIENGARTLSPSLDADGDGVSNAAEIAAGTDPLNPNSVFQLKNVTRTNGTSLRLDWTTVGGHSYVVQTNGNLGGGIFHDLSPVIVVPGTGEAATNYTHTNGAAAGSRFYRVRLGP